MIWNLMLMQLHCKPCLLTQDCYGFFFLFYFLNCIVCVDFPNEIPEYYNVLEVILSVELFKLRVNHMQMCFLCWIIKACVNANKLTSRIVTIDLYALLTLSKQVKGFRGRVFIIQGLEWVWLSVDLKVLYRIGDLKT